MRPPNKYYINIDITSKTIVMVHVKMLTIKAEILIKTNFLQYFSGKTVLTTSQDADGGRYRYIENCVSTRSTKKVFMIVFSKLRLRHDLKT